MKILVTALEILGGLAVFLYGIDMTSEGIQRAAGERLQKIFSLIMRNRITALFTGALVTMLIQSSSALTVITVSFVNAGMITLQQAIGVIMGANIGTTVTAWIVAATNAKSFSISLIAIPLFGLGYFISIIKHAGDGFKSTGRVFMGFALIFLGLNFISKGIPRITADNLSFLQRFSGDGYAGILLSVLVGTIFTVIVHSSSGSMAIIITLASQGVIDFRMAAALTLGANIGTTIDAFLATMNAGTNAKRAAWAHIIFNIAGTLWVILLFNPFLNFINLVLPANAGLAYSIAMFHLVFNMANSLIFLPFVNPFAEFLTGLIKDKEVTLAEFAPYGPLVPSKTPQLSLAQANKEIEDMSILVKKMFERFTLNIKKPIKDAKDFEKEQLWFIAVEDRLDQMREALSHFLLEIARMDVNDKTSENIGHLIHLVDIYENTSDSCMNLIYTLERFRNKKITISKNGLEAISKYTDLIDEMLTFLAANPGNRLTPRQIEKAHINEEALYEMCRTLKKKEFSKLVSGADVKTELRLIDLVRHIEKIGENTYEASKALRSIR